MIRIDLTMFSARLLKRWSLGYATIVNTGEGTPTRGTYEIKVYDKGGRLWKTGRLTDYPRKQLICWHLLQRLLNIAITPPAPRQAKPKGRGWGRAARAHRG